MSIYWVNFVNFVCNAREDKNEMKKRTVYDVSNNLSRNRLM